MYSKYLIHYNHNHDRLGRFARSAGSAGSKVGSAVLSSGKKKKKQQPPKADIKKGKAANTKLSDKERKRIVESGDAREVAKNKDRLSTRELETAVTRLQKEKVQRIDLEKKLSDLSDGGKQRQTAIQKIEKYGNDLERISNGLEKAAKMYNTAAQIHNLFSSGNDQWPLYGKEKKTEKEVSDAQRLRNLAKDKIKDSEVRKAQIKAYREEQMERDQLRDYERERTTKAYQSKQDEKRNKVVSDNEYATKYAESQLARRQAEDNLKDYENSRGESDEERRKRISKIPINIYDSDHYYDEDKKKKLRHSDLVDLGEDWLMHYNHNHDKLGRFARSNGTSVSGSLKKAFRTSPSDVLYDVVNKHDKRKDSKILGADGYEKSKEGSKYPIKLDNPNMSQTQYDILFINRHDGRPGEYQLHEALTNKLNAERVLNKDHKPITENDIKRISNYAESKAGKAYADKLYNESHAKDVYDFEKKINKDFEKVSSAMAEYDGSKKVTQTAIAADSAYADYLEKKNKISSKVFVSKERQKEIADLKNNYEKLSKDWEKAVEESKYKRKEADTEEIRRNLKVIKNHKKEYDELVKKAPWYKDYTFSWEHIESMEKKNKG